MSPEDSYPTVADVSRFAAAAPLTGGYRFELLRRDEIGAVIGVLQAWYRDVSVGSAACHFDECYYENEVLLEDSPQRDAIVLTLKSDAGLVGMFSCKLDQPTLAVSMQGSASPRPSIVARASQTQGSCSSRRSRCILAWASLMGWRR
jgi:hypothetical protein